MEKERQSLAGWILSRPDGKAFLAALLLSVMALATCIIVMEIRYEKSVEKREQCEKEKQQIIDSKNELFLNFVIEANKRGEIYRDKFDSLNIELLKLKR